MGNRLELPYALLKSKDYAALRLALAEENEVDIAGFMDELPREQAMRVFRLLHKEQAAEVFAELDGDVQEHIISAMGDEEIHEIIAELYVDDLVDMLEELPANMVRKVLKNTKPETRSLVNEFLQYPENSAGSIMTAEFIDLRKSMTVSDSIGKIRRDGAESEQIYTCYVIDDSRILEGVITVRELLLAPDDSRIDDLMEKKLITAKTTEDRELVAQRMMKYDLLALPIVDLEGRLVGIVTVDDVMDVLQEEATEDFERMAAMSPSEHPYLKASVFELAKNRFPWLLILMVSGMITGGILGRYEAAFAAVPLLVSFIPMLTDTGGNAGSQSSTLVIRGMTVGEIESSDLFRVLWKEVRVSALVGAALSLVNFGRLMLTYPDSTAISITVSLALFFTVILAKTVGGLLPILAKSLKIDPAIMAAPLITTVVDAISLVLYFSLAQRLLNL
ncbi:MAG: magnesium transporter [Clostridiales bacterium]|nr:magnesium transporter [Clostridiales bacterium]